MESGFQIGNAERRPAQWTVKPTVESAALELRFLADFKEQRPCRPTLLISAGAGFLTRAADWLGACTFEGVKLIGMRRELE